MHRINLFPLMCRFCMFARVFESSLHLLQYSSSSSWVVRAIFSLRDLWETDLNSLDSRRSLFRPKISLFRRIISSSLSATSSQHLNVIFFSRREGESKQSPRKEKKSEFESSWIKTNLSFSIRRNFFAASLSYVRHKRARLNDPFIIP